MSQDLKVQTKILKKYIPITKKKKKKKKKEKKNKKKKINKIF